jgi:putative MFS transporter
MLFIIRRFVPESPRWLASRGQAAKALETIDRIEKSVQRYSRSPLPQPDFSNHMRAAAMQRGSWREIFKGIYCRRTLNLWAIWFTLSFVHFGISNWLPTIYREVFHLPLRTALAYAAINPWFAVAGALFVALIIDRLGRRWTLSVALACVGGILIVLSLAGAQPLSFLIACCALLAFVATIIITGLYVYIPELYPTRVRGLGASSAGVWSRLGAIAGPATFGVLLHWNYSLPTIFMLLGIVGVIGGAAALLFSEETSGRVLEELSP